MGKNEEWTVNSGKWAYSKGASSQGEGAGRYRSRLAVLAGASVALSAIGLAICFSLGIIRFPLDVYREPVASASGSGAAAEGQSSPQSGSDTSQLQEENSRLKAELQEQQKLAEDKQRIIEQQRQDLDAEQQQLAATRCDDSNATSSQQDEWVREVVRAYYQALHRNDVDDAVNNFPTMSDSLRQSIRRIEYARFDGSISVSVSGRNAAAVFIAETKVYRERSETYRMRFSFSCSGDRWKIDNMNGSKKLN